MGADLEEVLLLQKDDTERHVTSRHCKVLLILYKIDGEEQLKSDNHNDTILFLYSRVAHY